MLAEGAARRLGRATPLDPCPGISLGTQGQMLCSLQLTHKKFRNDLYCQPLQKKQWSHHSILPPTLAALRLQESSLPLSISFLPRVTASLQPHSSSFSSSFSSSSHLRVRLLPKQGQSEVAPSASPCTCPFSGFPFVPSLGLCLTEVGGWVCERVQERGRECPSLPGLCAGPLRIRKAPLCKFEMSSLSTEHLVCWKIVGIHQCENKTLFCYQLGRCHLNTQSHDFEVGEPFVPCTTCCAQWPSLCVPVCCLHPHSASTPSLMFCSEFAIPLPISNCFPPTCV